MRRIILPIVVLCVAACGQAPVVCDTSAAVSLSITVKTSAGAPIEGASGTWTSSTGSGLCESISGALQCGHEVGGDLSVVVSAPGYVSKTVEAKIAHGECHVVGQQLDVALEVAPKATFDEDRRYVHAFFASQAECDAAQGSGRIMNCCAQATFRANGQAELIVTDIMNAGTYVRGADTIVFTRTTPGDVPAKVTFAIGTDGALTDDMASERWVRPATDGCF